MNILLTGPPRVGKTTAILRLVEMLPGGTAGGFYSTEIREGGRRTGFEIVALDGRRGILARATNRSGPRVGRYVVNVVDIDSVAVPAMRTAREMRHIIIVDEIGRMELFSPAFREEVIRCLDTGRVVGTIQSRSLPFLDQVRARDDVRLVPVTLSNRSEIPAMVLRLLGLGAPSG